MKSLFIVVLLVLSGVVFSQSALNDVVEKKKTKIKAPNTVVHLSVGGGPQYGLLGVKSVIGYNNFGLVLGLGGVADGAYQIGGQLGFGPIYVAVTYGSVGVLNDYAYNAKSVTFGTCINLNKNKRLFLDLGLGLYFDNEANHYAVDDYGLNLNAGLGYKLFKLK
ncbi:MAG: hypothetical protein JEZ03_13970 [Bacteroidales bacterium]|nr:hypothetical protein [Bacteroidales bacterium]